MVWFKSMDMKNFVLKFEIHESRQAVKFIFFGHHDEAYKR